MVGVMGPEADKGGRATRAPTAARVPRAIRTALRLLAVSAIASLVLVWRSITPSNHREWIPEQRVMPRVRFEGPLAHVQGVRDFPWQQGAHPAPVWRERTYDLDGLESVWFVLSPFGKSWRGPAHAMLSFGFSDSTFVAISVEARKQPGEGYSIWKGLLRRYELLYVVAEEHDMLPLRTLVHGNDVFLYPLRASREQARELFVSMLVQANDLARHPRFYNTLTRNCTTTLLRHANQVSTRPLPGGWRVLLPGYSDQILAQAGVLDTDLPLAEARARFRANDRIARCIDDPRFSACIRRRVGP